MSSSWSGHVNSNHNNTTAVMQVAQWILQANDPSTHDGGAQRAAAAALQHWTRTTSPDQVAATLFPLLFFQPQQQQPYNNDVTIPFFALTILGQQHRSLPPTQQRELRRYLLTQAPTQPFASSCSTVWRNKVAAVLAVVLVVQLEDAYDADNAAADTLLERDLLQLAASHPALFLTVLTTILDDFRSVSEAAAVDNEDDQEEQEAIPQQSRHHTAATIEQTRRLKDILKGYHLHGHNQQQQQQLQQQSTTTLLERLFAAVIHILSTSLQQQQQLPQHDDDNNRQLLPRLALQCVTALFQWTEVSFLGDRSSVAPCLELLRWAVRPTPPAPAALTGAALRAWREWVTSCSTNSGSRISNNNTNDNNDIPVLASSIQSVADPKLPVLCQLLDRIHETGMLPYPQQQQQLSHHAASTSNHKEVLPSSSSLSTASSSASSIDGETMEVIIEMAVVVNATGLELLPLYEQTVLSVVVSSSAENQNHRNAAVEALFNQVLDLFFRCFAYDDIDVATAVLPLAARLIAFMEEEQENQASSSSGSPNGGGDPPASSSRGGLRQHLSLFLNTLYNQMKYPADFGYDYENDDDAEEEVFRTELCKVYNKLVRVAPNTCLRFLCEAAASLGDSVATAPTPAVEATLRLVYHYCEGIRPPPGLKRVLKNETFGGLLVALHTSSVAQHPHAEVLCLYYESAVRYAPLFLKAPHTPLLASLLAALTGTTGLQHPAARVRSRCCYLLLRLVQTTVSLLRPYVETAVTGIQGLLSNASTMELLRPDDTLYLFETMGLLLGKTGLPATDQQRYLTAVMTPHVQSMERVLTAAGGQLQRDVEHYGPVLSGSIAALAYLSKGFSNNNKQQQADDEVKVVLSETLHITHTVLEALPNSEDVRNKSMVLLQRMIQCVGRNVLPAAAKFLPVLVAHCESDDILFVSQVFNQLCIKFKREAVPVIDGSLLPFLHKCSSLVPTQDEVAPGGPGSVPPHLRTEQLSVQKLAFAVLQHIVTHEVTAVLVSPSNAASLETILKTMSEGAISVPDPVIRRTCIRFFRELVVQWGASNSEEVDSVNRSGFLSFVCQSFVPGVFQSMMMSPSFDERDANQARVVTEFAHVLFAVKSTSVVVAESTIPANDLYQQCIGNMQGTGRFPLDLLEAFRLASSASDLEVCLQQILKMTKQNGARVLG